MGRLTWSSFSPMRGNWYLPSSSSEAAYAPHAGWFLCSSISGCRFCSGLNLSVSVLPTHARILRIPAHAKPHVGKSGDIPGVGDVALDVQLLGDLHDDVTRHVEEPRGPPLQLHRRQGHRPLPLRRPVRQNKKVKTLVCGGGYFAIWGHCRTYWLRTSVTRACSCALTISNRIWTMGRSKRRSRAQ